MILVIAEKPSVAQSIAKVLGATSRKGGYIEGGNYIVSWCFGHLVELADASSYDERYAKWRYDDLPIVPENWMFEVTKDKAQQFKVLSSLMKDKRVTELVCATDAGREGELIFRLVYDKAGCTKPFKRLWISSLEDSAIREGFNHLRDGKEYDASMKRHSAARRRTGSSASTAPACLPRSITRSWWSGASRRRPLQCWWSATVKSPRSKRRSISMSTLARAI